ncbi:MAG TPA: hypothetical protein VGR45_11820 [Stellaceae bacterium]|nr:hypothetical protein [Stellaceae bacterium]
MLANPPPLGQPFLPRLQVTRVLFGLILLAAQAGVARRPRIAGPLARSWRACREPMVGKR